MNPVPSLSPLVAAVAGQVDPTPSPTPPPSCLSDAVCQFVFQRTGLNWLAEGGYYFLVEPVRIILIILAALIVRFIVNRMVAKLTKRAVEGRPIVVMPASERMADPSAHATVRTERRRQRAQALASVLRSFVSISVFVIAVMMILSELGVNLAPLLASAGIAGIALGFGAQNLVKDFIAGLFMLLEDQYGVGDIVDLGEASGTVEAVGLRITTVRDVRGVLWYIRNGEIVRVGNRSQGWALVIVDVPVGFAGVDEATTVLRRAATAMAEDPAFAHDLIDAPEVLGIEQITMDGAIIRTTARTPSSAQWRIGRELRRRLTEALDAAGIARQMTATRVFVRPNSPGPEDLTGDTPTITDLGPGGTR